ncbi:MAG: hypothetical protein ABIM74_07800 [candidate division WOR-3 bacterium]
MLVLAFLIATPELGLEGGVSCGVCHLDPVGGGLRAGPGFGIGVRKIPFAPRQDYVPPYLNEEETITYGGDMRLFYARNSDRLSSYSLMQGDIYIGDALNERVYVYVDKGIWGGAEVAGYIWNLLLSGSYIKAGFFKPPFGLRTDDHQSYASRAGPVGPRSSDAGLEIGYNSEWLTISFAHQNGAPGAIFDSDTFRTVSARAIVFLRHLMFGGSFYKKMDRNYYGLSLGFSGFNFYPWADAVLVNSPYDSTYTLDLTAFLYWKPRRGFYPFFAYDLTQEYLRGTNITEIGERQRVGVRFIPMPFTEIYGAYGLVKHKGGKSYEDNEATLSLHFYY